MLNGKSKFAAALIASLLMASCGDPAPYPEETPPLDEARTQADDDSLIASDAETDDPVLSGDTIGGNVVPDRDGTLTQDDIREPDPADLDVDDVTMSDEQE